MVKVFCWYLAYVSGISSAGPRFSRNSSVIALTTSRPFSQGSSAVCLMSMSVLIGVG
jgi:hypothetical protein